MSITTRQICEGLQAVEQAALVSVDAAFHAGLWMPTREELLAISYPMSFHLVLGGGPVNYATGEPGQDASDLKKPVQHWRHVLQVPVLVGQSSNEMADLMDLTDPFVTAFYRAINANYRLGLEVFDTRIGQYEIGEMRFRDTTHFGVSFPVFVYVRERFTVAP